MSRGFPVRVSVVSIMGGLLALGGALPVAAGTVVLRSGFRVEGRILQRDPAQGLTMIVQDPLLKTSGRLTISERLIESVDLEPQDLEAGPATPAESEGDGSPAQESLEARDVSLPPFPVEWLPQINRLQLATLPSLPTLDSQVVAVKVPGLLAPERDEAQGLMLRAPDGWSRAVLDVGERKLTVFTGPGERASDLHRFTVLAVPHPAYGSFKEQLDDCQKLLLEAQDRLPNISKVRRTKRFSGGALWDLGEIWGSFDGGALCFHQIVLGGPERTIIVTLYAPEKTFAELDAVFERFHESVTPDEK